MAIEILATKKELLRAIRGKCFECMNGAGNIKYCVSPKCSLYNYRFAATKVPDQTHLFKLCDKEDFMSNVLKAAFSFGSNMFFWSQLRKRVNAVPLNSNWYGGATAVLRKNGFRIVAGAIKKSEFVQRKGYDRAWVRVSS